MTEKQRPFFCLAAFPGEEIYGNQGLNSVANHIGMALRYPTRAQEFELAAESQFRAAGLDPSRSKAWEGTGLSREVVAHQISSAYKAAVPQLLEHLRDRVKTDPYDFVRYDSKTRTSSGVLGPSPLERAIDSLTRAHCEDKEFNILSDSAWEEVGVKGGLAGLRELIQDIFVKGKVGGYYIGESTDFVDPMAVSNFSRVCADAHFRDVFPAAADKLGVPQVHPGLISWSEPSPAGKAFGGVAAPA